MIKGRKLTYLLIVCVSGVWGIIFYRIYKSVDVEEVPFVMSDGHSKSDYFKLINHKPDEVKLNLDYRDPFAEPSAVEIELPQRNATNDLKMPVELPLPKPVVNWSGVKYTGYIQNPSAKNKIAIMQVNGTTAMLEEGQTMHGLKLIKYAGDSVKVQYQNSTKFITLK